jgi:hypothetical protein
MLCANAVTAPCGGAYVFSWLPNSDRVAKQFLESLLRISNELKPDAIVRLAFNDMENLAISPDWWESMGEARCKQLLKRAEIGGNIFVRDMSLEDDGLRVAQVRVLSIDTNFEMSV